MKQFYLYILILFFMHFFTVISNALPVTSEDASTGIESIDDDGDDYDYGHDDQLASAARLPHPTVKPVSSFYSKFQDALDYSKDVSSNAYTSFKKNIVFSWKFIKKKVSQTFITIGNFFSSSWMWIVNKFTPREPVDLSVNQIIKDEGVFDKAINNIILKVSKMPEHLLRPLLEKYVEELVSTIAYSMYTISGLSVSTDIMQAVYNRATDFKSSHPESLFPYSDYNNFLAAFLNPIRQGLKDLAENVHQPNTYATISYAKALPVLEEWVTMLCKISQTPTLKDLQVQPNLKEFLSSTVEFGMLFLHSSMKPILKELSSFIDSDVGLHAFETDGILSSAGHSVEFEAAEPFHLPVIPLVTTLSKMLHDALSSDMAIATVNKAKQLARNDKNYYTETFINQMEGAYSSLLGVSKALPTLIEEHQGDIDHSLRQKPLGGTSVLNILAPIVKLAVETLDFNPMVLAIFLEVISQQRTYLLKANSELSEFFLQDEADFARIALEEFLKMPAGMTRISILAALDSIGYRPFSKKGAHEDSTGSPLSNPTAKDILISDAHDHGITSNKESLLHQRAEFNPGHTILSGQENHLRRSSTVERSFNPSGHILM